MQQIITTDGAQLGAARQAGDRRVAMSTRARRATIHAVLIATSHWSDGTSTLRATVFLGRGLRAQLVHREGLLYDSRFAYSPASPQGLATVYLVRDGTFAPSTGAEHVGRSVWALREDESEHVVAGATTFRSWGEPFVGMTLVVSECDLVGEIGIGTGPRDADRTWGRFDALHAAVESSERHEGILDLLEALADDGILTRGVARSVRDAPEPAALNRIWAAVAGRYAEQDTGVYADLFAAMAGLSTRQIARELSKVVQTFPLFGSYRDTVRTLRLRRAVLLLSAPSLRVSDVARIVGYGSVDAMGRAFRDAGLPPPRAIRDLVRAAE